MYNKKRVSCCRCIQCRRKNISAFPCKRNKSIVLHRVLPNSPKNFFLQRCYCGLRIRLQVKCRTARKGKPISMFERGRVPYNMNITSLFFSMNNRSVMLQLFMLWKTNKVSYCIPLREVQSIRLHHVLPNSSENVSVVAVCYSEIATAMSQTVRLIIWPLLKLFISRKQNISKW